MNLDQTEIGASLPDWLISEYGIEKAAQVIVEAILNFDDDTVDAYYFDEHGEKCDYVRPLLRHQEKWEDVVLAARAFLHEIENDERFEISRRKRVVF